MSRARAMAVRVGLVVLALVAAPGAAQARAAKPADLVVVAAQVSPGSGEPAGRVTVGATVANAGGRRSAASDVEYVLARGRRPLAADLRLVATQRVAALPAGARHRAARIAALLPPTARNGTYRVFACVRVRAPARETVTGNNCRLAGSVRIASTPQGRVAPVRSDDRAVTAVVGAEGGTVEATAGDGTVLRLVVPEGALATPLQLRLVPLAGVGGLAVAGATVLGGVEIEPAGLLLEAVARLEVTPPAGAAAPSLAASYDLGGADLHLVPVLHRPAFAVLVTRLGGYVVLHADAPRTAAARVRLPARPLYRMEQAFAELQLGGPAHRAVARIPAADGEFASAGGGAAAGGGPVRRRHPSRAAAARRLAPARPRGRDRGDAAADADAAPARAARHRGRAPHRLRGGGERADAAHRAHGLRRADPPLQDGRRARGRRHDRLPVPRRQRRRPHRRPALRQDGRRGPRRQLAAAYGRLPEAALPLRRLHQQRVAPGRPREPREQRRRRRLERQHHAGGGTQRLQHVARRARHGARFQLAAGNAPEVVRHRGDERVGSRPARALHAAVGPEHVQRPQRRGDDPLPGPAGRADGRDRARDRELRHGRAAARHDRQAPGSASRRRAGRTRSTTARSGPTTSTSAS